MRIRLAATALISAIAVASMASTAHAVFRFNGRIDGDAQLYRRSYGTSGGFNNVTTNRTRCPRNRSLLGLFSNGNLNTGTEGVTFPVLINGNCPISAGILKYRERTTSPFGSMDF